MSKPDFFSVVASAESTTDMVYLTSDICGILYPSYIVDSTPVVLHGLRTKSANWGLLAEHSTTVVHGSMNIQLNVSNADWETDCGRFCPTVKRHISDFAGQCVFAYSGRSAMPDIIRQMQQSAVVWRPLPDCHNKNCRLGAREEDDGQNNW